MTRLTMRRTASYSVIKYWRIVYLSTDSFAIFSAYISGMPVARDVNIYGDELETVVSCLFKKTLKLCESEKA